MSKSSDFFRCICGAALGAIPGMLIYAVVSPRVGVSIMALGSAVGALLSLPGVSAKRTFKLFAATIVRYNLPVSERIFDWVDTDGNDTSEDATASQDKSDAFAGWILAVGIAKRRRGFVLLALVVGLIAGIAISVNEIATVKSGDKSLVLPFKACKDSLTTQGILFAIAFAVWMASVAGVIASAAYRRPILVAVLAASFFGGTIGYAADNGTGPGPLRIAFFFATAAAATAILVASLVSSSDQQSDETTW